MILAALLPDYTGELKEMAKSLQLELKSLVSWGWTYGVIWKIGLDHRTPIWYEGNFNETHAKGALAGPAQQFEFIYRQCQFTPARPGYAYLAWQQQSPLWWTRNMDPVLTDKNKELFLAEAGIQTITCFPGRAIPDGTPYCVELACTALVSETEFLRTSIQEFLSTSIDPYISSYQMMMQQGGAVGLDMESSASSAAMVRALDHQTSAILTDITIQASMGEDEVIDGLGTMLRREEPYSPWTTYGANLQSFEISHHPNPNSYAAHFHDLSFNYGSLLLPEPFSNPLIQSDHQWTVPRDSEGKEFLVDQSDLVLDKSNSMSLLQQELLEKLRSPPATSTSPRPAPSGTGSFRNVRMPPGHSATSLFQRPRHVQKTTSTKKSRLPLIVKWATKLASRTVRIRDDGPAGSFDDSPGTDTLEYRSPNSVAHDHQAAVAHKNAERVRRMKFSHKLQTLISIVPMTNKKKDKVSVLTSTIEYIRQLNSQISTYKKVEEVGALTSRIEEGTLTANDMDREEELITSNVDVVEAGAGPSTSAAAPVVVVVMVEESSSPGEDTKWVIKVDANYHSRSLILLLNVLLELELETVTVNYGRTDGRFHANISVKTSRNASTTSIEELQGKLCRVLETSDS